MNSCKPRINHESSKSIPIPERSPTNKKGAFYNNKSFNEYSLKQNFFDPSKSSPPNDFMLKLQLRMSFYDSFNKDANLLNE
jgi:hypothetical protein